MAPSTVLLTVGDFAPGSVDETGTAPPAAPGCAPTSPGGLLQSAVFRVTDTQGENWSNVVFAFDTATDANAFATAFFAAGQRCATGSGAVADTLGDYSFRYTQKGYGSGFGDATVRVVQVKYLVTLVLDGPNIGPYPPASELSTHLQTSVSRLMSATA